MDPNASVSIDAIVADLSKKADASDQSPADASETPLVSVPDAIAHLVDSEESPHLASGPFSIIRLDQGGNGIAIFARVGKKLQWPLTRDQAAVKLDAFHYFFAVTVPPEIEEECSAAEKKAPSKDDNILNYGITFSESTDRENLKQLDDILNRYCCYKAPKIASQKRGESDPKVAAVEIGRNIAEKDLGVDDAAPIDLTGVPAAAYWTVLAPNIEDYSNSVARSIASGAGQIIKGIIWCSETTVSQLKKGNSFMQGRIKSTDTPMKIGPTAMRRIQRVQKISAMSEQFVVGVLSGVIKAAAFIARPLVTSTVGQKLLNLMPGQIALASLEGFGKIFDALEVAGRNVLTTTSSTTTGLVTQRYGDEAGQFTQQGFNAIGGFLTTAWTISKLRKVFYPSNFVKSAAKVANEEKRLKGQNSQNAQMTLDSDEKQVKKPITN